MDVIEENTMDMLETSRDPMTGRDSYKKLLSDAASNKSGKNLDSIKEVVLLKKDESCSSSANDILDQVDLFEESSP